MRRAITTKAMIVCSTALLGCGGGEQFYSVTGSVSLDGQPLDGATVSFVSTGDQPSNSIGVTDAAGRYSLRRTVDVAGIPAGSYRVHISTFRSDDDEGTVAVPERVPECYNTQSTLQAMVNAGENEINFELSSDGTTPMP